MATAGPGIVLVPGGFTGAWMWADVVALLELEGIEARAVELPTIGEDSAGADFHADAGAVRELLDRLEPPVLLCGHSYGGAVITEAASGPHPSVRELLYVTAAVPGAGDSMVSLMSAAAVEDRDAEEEGVTVRDDGLALLDPGERGRLVAAAIHLCARERGPDARGRRTGVPRAGHGGRRAPNRPLSELEPPRPRCKAARGSGAVHALPRWAEAVAATARTGRLNWQLKRH